MTLTSVTDYPIDVIADWSELKEINEHLLNKQEKIKLLIEAITQIKIMTFVLIKYKK